MIGIVVAGLLVNWRSQLWSKLHEELVNSVYANTDPAHPIMADQPATVKFLNELHGQRMLVDLDLGNESNEVRRYQLLRLLDRNQMVQIVLFGRDDSDYWLSKSRDDEGLYQRHLATVARHAEAATAISRVGRAAHLERADLSERI